MPSYHLTEIQILRTGVDGGHLYLKARGHAGELGICDIYAYFGSRTDEQKFEKEFAGQNITVEASDMTLNSGVGASINEVLAWRFL
jgi:hypothetical protein